jgi:anaerobic ribonucleoside-triphosphate reductase
MKELETIDNQIEEISKKMEDQNLGKGTANTMTRVSGYVRAINNFNIGKQQEYRDRLEYEVK